MDQRNPAPGLHADARQMSGPLRKFGILNPTEEDRLASGEGLPCRRPMQREPDIGAAGIAGVHLEKLHHHAVGLLVVEAQGRCVQGHHLVQTGRDGAKQLAHVHVGEQCLAQLKHHGFFGPFAIGKIARHLGKSGQFAIAVANGGKNDICPESRSAFANSPALLLDPAALSSQFHQFRGSAALQILLGEETREVLSYDLVWCVLLHALRSGVPCGDVTLGVE